MNVQQGKQAHIMMQCLYHVVILIFCRTSAHCTHVSALLYALVSLTSPQFQIQPTNLPQLQLNDDDALPVTFRPMMSMETSQKKKGKHHDNG